MLASHHKTRNQIVITSMIVLSVVACLAYLDIFSPGLKRAFGYVWLVGVVVQLIVGLYWAIAKYKNQEFLFQKSSRHKKKSV